MQGLTYSEEDMWSQSSTGKYGKILSGRNVFGSY
jgi:hypothetical protein